MTALVRLLGWLLAVALVALPIVAVLNGWIGSEQWPLTRLRATGQFDRVDAQRLRETLLPYAREGFFAVRLDDAQAAVAALPWVEHAEVRKRWPDVLEVRVTEYQPFARWGEEQLLSEHGELFRAQLLADASLTGLPRLDGPELRVEDVVALYNQARLLFAPLGLRVESIEVDARGSWQLRLRNPRTGYVTRVVVGRKEARARLARFARLAPQLLSQDQQQLQRADLRYPNGFALRWEPVANDSASSGTGDGSLAFTNPQSPIPNHGFS